ncbi:bifunctional riboflavin kinase/FAD synthetase [Marinicella sp. S1101]|uniref:bifunctional riboflavin kinase/FAD synthetase n=1 Tax=Marinicella marina TaxID=2996016 RepID=UPI0022609C98|nr:bifunctional riboflavin kinase/FAD synthetase [Marinicella marina]MCX7554638.1 bifunctional riboflavin kinase/FAD synthetase [Marinicella marina]MDJ1140703.1 bifunctional riboflavin kinase/FAD synthetase [Marinicella marina]
MEIIRYPHHNPLSTNSSVTIGNFDGVHVGHQALIRKTIEHAKAHGNQSVVVSMQPLPLQHFNGFDAIELLTSFRLKHRLLKQMGVDVFCNLNFNAELASMTATAFFEKVLIHGLKAGYVVIGDDFKFGANRQGDFNFLQNAAVASDVSVEKIASVLIQGQRVSSTAIRQLLNAGEFEAAKKLLGRDFNLIGRVAHGKKLGRELGYPTINLELKQRAFPLYGIYVCEININEQWYQGVASVGFNPSVGGNAKRVEVYVLDFKQQVYGQCVEVLFYKKLRNEVKFDTLNDLIAGIEDDVHKTRKYFADLQGEPV